MTGAAGLGDEGRVPLGSSGRPRQMQAPEARLSLPLPAPLSFLPAFARGLGQDEQGVEPRYWKRQFGRFVVRSLLFYAGRQSVTEFGGASLAAVSSAR